VIDCIDNGLEIRILFHRQWCRPLLYFLNSRTYQMTELITIRMYNSVLCGPSYKKHIHCLRLIAPNRGQLQKGYFRRTVPDWGCKAEKGEGQLPLKTYVSSVGELSLAA
jgi:hypothetical protein